MKYNEPKEGRCNTCRHWRPGAPHSDGVWGVCLLASHANGKPLVDVKFGNSGFIAGTLAPITPVDTNLNTRGDFGCIEYRSKAHE